MDEPNVSADDFERAFCEAVQRYAAEEWTPAIPDQRMILCGSASRKRSATSAFRF